VQLAESVLYNPLFGVEGTEGSWSAGDLKGNPTEYTHHTIGELANCAAFKSQGKGPNQQTPTFHISQLTCFNFNFHFCDINVLAIFFFKNRTNSQTSTRQTYFFPLKIASTFLSKISPNSSEKSPLLYNLQQK
jgi:hypothetical protein